MFSVSFAFANILVTTVFSLIATFVPDKFTIGEDVALPFPLMFLCWLPFVPLGRGSMMMC